MEKKHVKHGVEQLLKAAVNLSQFAMVTSTPPVFPSSILKSSNDTNTNSKWSNDISTVDKYNWLLHIMYGRSEYDRIQQFIRIQSFKSTYMTYIQALVYRQEGRIVDALDYFQKCVIEEPSLIHIKQVGKSLALLGRYRLAIDVYKDALKHAKNDWDILYNIGLNYFHLNELTEAKRYFLQALQVSEIQEVSYLSLGKMYLLDNEREEAETVFQRGANRNPESPTLFTELGLRAFAKANYTKAFECFGTALTFAPTYIPALMAACQVIQKHGDADVALSKYRIIYRQKPECAQVWNNIGMCFFSKKKYVAAVSCLKRANYLAPFELYVLYNLALVHLHLQQNASAAIFLQSAIRLDKRHAASYALLGIALSKLNDTDNALRAFTYSIKRDPTDPIALLNLAIFQKNTGVSQSSIDITLTQFHQYYKQRVAVTNQKEIDKSMLDVAAKLQNLPSFAPQNNEIVVVPPQPTILFSPNKPVIEDSMNLSKSNPHELSALRTKTYEDRRFKQKQSQHQPITSLDNTDFEQNEPLNFSL
ncbi:unnamed protein product [Adineta steineri]|uniref:Uncharacterized protein n=1 Tax=Adineta steineri TaxID=433720 RepID=A0A815RCW3_9BILA|nr:unnamed protein product [Adineta steineri]CAF3733279.1 unnamed protein product [Adineta steineri]